MPRGGKRPGAGLPKGYKFAQTLTKDAAREQLRAMVFAELKPMVDAQIANAKGLKYLVVRDKTGKFVKVTEAMAGAFNGDETVEVWEKDPAVQAFTDLINRALDKPAEHVEMTVTKTQNASDEELSERLAQLSQKLRLVKTG